MLTSSVVPTKVSNMSNEDSPTVNDLRKILLDHGHRIIDAIKREKAMSRWEPIEEPEVRREDPDEEHSDWPPDRCPHGVILTWYEGTRSSVCADCQESLAELQASEAAGK